MSRTIEEIKAEMTQAFMNDATTQTAYGFAANSKFSDHFSTLSIENILFYVFAVCAYTIERLTETHLSQVEATIKALRPHTCTWYQTMALAFRYGETLDPNTATYATVATSDTLMPISQCAVTENSGGGLTIKVATTDSSGSLTPLEPSVLTAFKSYMADIKDAGIATNILSQAGDRLQLDLTVYVDATVFNLDGTLITEPTRPVENAIREYLTMLPFNGELVLEHLIDHLQGVRGVEVPHINTATTCAIDPTGMSGNGYANMTAIDVRTTPESGFFRISFSSSDDWASTITYRSKS